MPYGNGASGLSQGFGAPRNNIMSSPALAFKTSPFYRIETVIGDVRICEGWYLLLNDVMRAQLTSFSHGSTPKYDDIAH